VSFSTTSRHKAFCNLFMSTPARMGTQMPMRKGGTIRRLKEYCSKRRVSSYLYHLEPAAMSQNSARHWQMNLTMPLPMPIQVYISVADRM
jgi:hypothetical protein